MIGENLKILVEKSKSNGCQVLYDEIIESLTAEYSLPETEYLDKLDDAVNFLNEQEIQIVYFEPDYEKPPEKNDEEEKIYSLKPANLLDMYMKSIPDLPILSKKEEQELIKKARDGDTTSRDKLVEHNLRFVVKTACHYSDIINKNHRLSLLDLIQEGNCGLLTAIERFDCTKECRFLSYAVHWITREIKKTIRECMPVVHIPFYQIDTALSYQRTINKLTKQLSREPTTAEIAEEIKIDASKLDEIIRVHDIYSSARNTIPLDSLDGNENKSPKSENELLENIENMIRQEAIKWAIEKELNFLNKEEKKLIEERFGLKNGGEERTLTEIAKVNNVSRTTIQDRLEKTLKKMKLSPHLRNLLPEI